MTIVRLCWEARDLKELNAHILVVAKRRAQLKQVIVDLVQAAMALIPDMGAVDDRLELIATLRTVTEGKIFVEVERARLTLMLAKLKEEGGKLGDASEILQEVAIETFGSMEKREKAEFLLEQVRITGATKDWIKMSILANKMNKKLLDEAGFEVRTSGRVAAPPRESRSAGRRCAICVWSPRPIPRAGRAHPVLRPAHRAAPGAARVAVAVQGLPRRARHAGVGVSRARRRRVLHARAPRRCPALGGGP